MGIGRLDKIILRDNMKYKEGGKIISKKFHACGGNEWIVVRTGVDVKLKCVKCQHVVFLSVDKLDKMVKTYNAPPSQSEGIND